MKNITLCLYGISSVNLIKLHNKEKVNTTAQEIIRRLKNTSRDLDPEVIEDVLQEYMSDLEQGGYPETWRTRVLETAVTGYKRIGYGQLKLQERAMSTDQDRPWQRVFLPFN